MVEQWSGKVLLKKQPWLRAGGLGVAREVEAEGSACGEAPRGEEGQSESSCLGALSGGRCGMRGAVDASSHGTFLEGV